MPLEQREPCVVALDSDEWWSLSPEEIVRRATDPPDNFLLRESHH